MPRLFVAGLIISLAVALIAAAQNSTDTTGDHKLIEHSTEKTQLAKNATENPSEAFKHHRPPSDDCGDNEIWSRCGKACQNTCKRRGGFCLVKICSKEWDGCRCKSGYVRNRKGKCVKPEDCKMCNRSKK